MIPAYFAQIKELIDRYAGTSFVLDSAVSFETRPGDQGFVSGSFLFQDESRFFFREYLDATSSGIDKLMYSYHYQNADTQLVFRYDNARHRPELPFTDHKHLSSGEVSQVILPDLAQVMAEIASSRGWL